MNPTSQFNNIRTLPTADIELPPSLERLRDIAYDYWWSWSPIAQRLFGRIDPVAWRRYHNPVQLLINVEPQQWMRLLSDPEFEMAKAYAAFGIKKNYGKEYEGLIRSTFRIDENGIVEEAQYNVRAKGHVDRIKQAIEA